MKDKLEKYISENRRLFDDHEPGDKLWNKIAANIKKPEIRKSNNFGFIWKVAAAVIIFVASYFFHDYMHHANHINAPLAVKEKEKTVIKNKPNPVYNTKVEHPVSVISSAVSKKQNIAVINNKNVRPDNNELAEMKAYYTIQINDKENEIYRFTAFNPNIKKQICVEFSQLDSIYNSLKKDLKDNIDNKEVVEAMIQNYHIRLEILENMLNQLKENDTIKTKKNHYEI